MEYETIKCKCGNNITKNYLKADIDDYHFVFVCEYCGQVYKKAIEPLITIE